MAVKSYFLSKVLIHRELIADLVKRDFAARYRGSVLGVFWSVLGPILMLGMYTLVFSVAFKARWPGMDESQSGFAVMFFSGMIVHSFFADCLNRSSILIAQHASFVKKVLFPLELLPLMVVLSTLLHFMINFFVLLVFAILCGFKISFTVLVAPIVLLPLTLIALGLSWFIAALGVFVRDLSQIVNFLSSITLFLAPVFYAPEALPPRYQACMVLNPITLPVMQLRDVTLIGKGIQWEPWFISLVISGLIFFVGYSFFQKTRNGFADVL